VSAVEFGSEVDGVDDSSAVKDRMRPEELISVWLSLAAVFLCVVAVAFFYFFKFDVGDEEGATVLVGLGAASAALGLWTGVRMLVGAFVAMTALASVLVTRELEVLPALVANATVVAYTFVVAIIASFAFDLRRGSNVDSRALTGFGATYAAVWAVGSVTAAATTVAMTGLELPAWTIIFPIAGLTIATLLFTRSLRSIRRKLEPERAPLRPPTPPPPPGAVRGPGTPPPARPSAHQPPPPR